MNLEDLTIDLNTIVFRWELANELVDILVGEGYADQITLKYAQRIRTGEVSFIQGIDELVNYLKSLIC